MTKSESKYKFWQLHQIVFKSILQIFTLTVFVQNLCEWFECVLVWIDSPQPAISCSKLTIEILEQGVKKYVQS